MSYYITAHRYGSKFNVPVEEKHKYITDGLRVSDSEVIGISDALPESALIKSSNVFTIRKPIYTSYIQNDKSIIPTTSSNQVFGLNLISNYVHLFYRPSMLTIEQGTGARQRIGDKIFLKNIQIMINLSAMKDFYEKLLGNSLVQSTTQILHYPVSFSPNTPTPTASIIVNDTDTTNFYTYFNARMNTKQFMKFRIMIVRFDDLSDDEEKKEEDLKIFIRRWFNEIYVPLAIVPKTDDNYLDLPVVSNQSKMLRESTQYTGSYKILYDEMIELNQNDYSKYIKINLEPKMNLTFKDSDNTPTTEVFNNVFGFIIPPTYYKTDMDVCTYNNILRGTTTDYNIAEFTTNIKFTYYDI